MAAKKTSRKKTPAKSGSGSRMFQDNQIDRDGKGVYSARA